MLGLSEDQDPDRPPVRPRFTNVSGRHRGCGAWRRRWSRACWHGRFRRWLTYKSRLRCIGPAFLRTRTGIEEKVRAKILRNARAPTRPGGSCRRGAEHYQINPKNRRSPRFVDFHEILTTTSVPVVPTRFARLLWPAGAQRLCKMYFITRNIEPSSAEYPASCHTGRNPARKAYDCENPALSAHSPSSSTYNFLPCIYNSPASTYDFSSVLTIFW